MYRIVFVFFFFIHSLSSSNAQQRIIKAEALMDIDYFFDVARRVHPNLYSKVSRIQMEQKIAAFKSQLSPSIDVDDFSKGMRKLVNQLGDGHTNVLLSNRLREEYLKGNKRLPFHIRIKENHLFISESTDQHLKIGDQILSLNGIDAEALMGLASYPYADVRANAIKLLEKYFSYYFFIEYGLSDSIDVKYLHGEKMEHVCIPLVSGTPNTGERKYRYSKVAPHSGLLEMNSFAGLKEKKFKSFLDSIWDTFSQEGVDTLFVDLRSNGGGNSYFAELLLAYLGVKQTRLHRQYRVKTSGPLKRYMRKKYFKWYTYPLYPLAYFNRSGRIFFFKKNGTITDLDTEPHPLSPPRNAFGGKVFVLTSPSTYSAAANFVVGFKYAQRGKVVGDTLGQPYSGFIDKMPFVLPHSGLHAGVSFKRYSYVGATANNGQKGVAPDVYFDPERMIPEENGKKRINPEMLEGL